MFFFYFVLLWFIRTHFFLLNSIILFWNEILHFQTDTLNPFEINGQFFGSGELNNDIYIENKDLYNYSKAQDDAKQELLDLRRQVVYLQVFARFPVFIILWFYWKKTKKFKIIFIILPSFFSK